MDQIKIGNFIAELRKEKELTQKQLAEQLGVSDKTISKWECGKGLPELSLMLNLCNFFEITVNEFLSGELLAENDYRNKAEENIVTLMKTRRIKKQLINILISVVLFFLSILSIFFSADKILPPIMMPVIFFVNIMGLISNFVAGIVYGVTKKWNVLFIVFASVLNLAFLLLMIYLFAIMFFTL